MRPRPTVPPSDRVDLPQADRGQPPGQERRRATGCAGGGKAGPEGPARTGQGTGRRTRQDGSQARSEDRPPRHPGQGDQGWKAAVGRGWADRTEPSTESGVGESILPRRPLFSSAASSIISFSTSHFAIICQTHQMPPTRTASDEDREISPPALRCRPGRLPPSIRKSSSPPRTMLELMYTNEGLGLAARRCPSISRCW